MVASHNQASVEQALRAMQYHGLSQNNTGKLLSLLFLLCQPVRLRCQHTHQHLTCMVKVVTGEEI